MLIIDVLLLCCASGQDIDCFYAQSEVLRCPSLRGRPVGVTQVTQSPFIDSTLSAHRHMIMFIR